MAVMQVGAATWCSYLVSFSRGGVDESVLVAHEGGNVQRFAPSNALYRAMASGGADVRDVAPIRVSVKAHKDNIQVGIKARNQVMEQSRCQGASQDSQGRHPGGQAIKQPKAHDSEGDIRLGRQVSNQSAGRGSQGQHPGRQTIKQSVDEKSSGTQQSM
eukprot:1158106-Pelagomonas_calceolata.AAC.3